MGPAGTPSWFADGAGGVRIETRSDGATADILVGANADVVSGEGAITLVSAGDVRQDTGGDILTGSGTIDVTAAGEIEMSDDARASTGEASGDIMYHGGSDVIVGGVFAGTGSVSIVASNGYKLRFRRGHGNLWRRASLRLQAFLLLCLCNQLFLRFRT